MSAIQFFVIANPPQYIWKKWEMYSCTYLSTKRYNCSLIFENCGVCPPLFFLTKKQKPPPTHQHPPFKNNEIIVRKAKLWAITVFQFPFFKASYLYPLWLSFRKLLFLKWKILIKCLFCQQIRNENLPVNFIAHQMVSKYSPKFCRPPQSMLLSVLHLQFICWVMFEALTQMSLVHNIANECC